MLPNVKCIQFTFTISHTVKHIKKATGTQTKRNKTNDFGDDLNAPFHFGLIEMFDYKSPNFICSPFVVHRLLWFDRSNDKTS